jgi:ComEC/Rec2-related protein
MSQNRLILVVLCCFLVLRFYFFFSAPKLFSSGDNIRISATIRSEPLKYENSQYVRLYGLKVYLPSYPVISYGDKVVVEGMVEKDRLKSAKLISVKPTRGLIYKFRSYLLEFYDKSLPLPYSGLIEGITIGSKSGISSYFWDKLKNSGTAHIVVASGMNISLVAGFLLGLFTLFMKRKKALILALFGVWAYAILSGFDAPIVRSAIMGSVGFTAQELGRLNISLRALLASAAIMLFVNPGYIQDVGFLLSFFATLGLILLEKRIRERISVVPAFIREDLSTTLAAQIGVFPILLWAFGKFSPLSPIVNVLVLWTVVPMTIIGMTGGMIGLVVPVVGKGILFLTYPLAWWFVSFVEVFG